MWRSSEWLSIPSHLPFPCFYPLSLLIPLSPECTQHDRLYYHELCLPNWQFHSLLFFHLEKRSKKLACGGLLCPGVLSVFSKSCLMFGERDVSISVDMLKLMLAFSVVFHCMNIRLYSSVTPACLVTPDCTPSDAAGGDALQRVWTGRAERASTWPLGGSGCWEELCASGLPASCMLLGLEQPD